MIKQVIVARNDLNMRKGKLAAQVSHASMKIFFDMMKTETREIPVFNVTPDYKDSKGYEMTPMVIKSLYFHRDDPRLQWMEGIFTKVVLQGHSLEHICFLAEKAFDLNIPYATIEDHGNTEFNCKQCNFFEECENNLKSGTSNYKCDKMRVTTCIAIGPHESEVIDLITRDLKLF